MNEDNKTGCLICSAEIVYTTESVDRKCTYCENNFNSTAVCSNDHFICDNCHSSSALDLIQNTCNVSKIEDPVELAILLMKNPQLKMHGPEHHFLVPAVLFTSYQNQIENTQDRKTKLEAIRTRAELVKGGFCGTHGSCGAAIGAGIFCSVLTDTTPLSTDTWRLSNKITAQCLNTVADHGGPRCCKRDTFLSILSSKDFLEKHMKINLKVNQPVECDFSDMNKDCLLEECDFYIN
jgi:hypothetical protein